MKIFIIITIINYYFSLKYIYLVKDNLYLTKNKIATFNIEEYKNKNWWITFKISFFNENMDNIIHFKSKIIMWKIGQWSHNIVIKFNKDNTEPVCFIKFNPNNSPIKDMKCDLDSSIVKSDILKFESKNTYLLITNLVLSYDEVEVITKNNLVNNKKIFNYEKYLKTIILINFFENIYKSKFLFNNITNYYGTNKIGFSKNIKTNWIQNNNNDLISGIDTNGYYIWRAYSKCGNFKLNGVFTKTLNNKPMKNLMFIFNLELYFDNDIGEFVLLNFNDTKLIINYDNSNNLKINFKMNENILLSLSFDNKKFFIHFKALIIKIWFINNGSFVFKDHNLNIEILYNINNESGTNYYKSNNIKNENTIKNIKIININFDPIIIGVKECISTNKVYSYIQFYEFQWIEGHIENLNINNLESIDYNNNKIKNINEDNFNSEDHRNNKCNYNSEDNNTNCKGKDYNIDYSEFKLLGSEIRVNYDFDFNKIYKLSIVLVYNYNMSSDIKYKYIELSIANKKINFLINDKKKDFHEIWIFEYSEQSITFELDDLKNQFISYKIHYKIEYFGLNYKKDENYEGNINDKIQFDFNFDCRFFLNSNFSTLNFKNSIKSECISLNKLEDKFYNNEDNSLNECQENCKKCKYFNNTSTDNAISTKSILNSYYMPYCYQSKLPNYILYKYNYIKNAEKESEDYESNESDNCDASCLNCLKNKFCWKCKINYYFSNLDNKICLDKNGCADMNCSYCLDGYFKNNGNSCSLCSDYCNVCINNYECLVCKKNSILDKFTNLCKLNDGCIDNECNNCKENYSFIKPGLCLECIKNCKICLKYKTCLICEKNYYNSFDKCIKLSSFCLKSNGYSCIQCKDNYYIDKGICKKLNMGINNIDNKDCSEGYILFNNNCNITDNVYINNNCLSKYFTLNINDNKLCVSNDIRVKIFKPLELNHIYYENSINKLIYKKNNNLINNCSLNLNEYKCEICSKGYFNEDNQCIKITISHCKEPINHNNCYNCYNGFYLNNIGRCISNLSNCKKSKIINKNRQCTLCNNGFFLNKYNEKCNLCDINYCGNCYFDKCLKCKNIKDIYLDKKFSTCKKCTYPCKNVQNQNIIKCYNGYYLNNSYECLICQISFCSNCYKNICLKCNRGFYLKDNICIKCSKNCLLCKNMDICYKTINPYFIENNTVKKCFSNCLVCLDLYTCLKCNEKKNYFLNINTNSCMKIKNCKVIKSGNCIECNDNYYLNYKTLKCEICNEYCNTCFYSKDYCLSCIDGYILKDIIEFNGIKKKCFKKCLNHQIFSFLKLKCISCSFIEWNFYNYYYLKLDIPKEIIIKFKKELILKNIQIYYKEKLLKYSIKTINKSFIILKLDFTFQNYIMYFHLNINKQIFTNSNTICSYLNYELNIRSINRTYKKIYYINKIFKKLDKNSEQYKNIKSISNYFETVAKIVSFVLLITTILTPKLGNILSKMFNTFQFISFISYLNIDFSKTLNSIFDIVNLNLSVNINLDKYIGISKQKQSYYSYNSYKYNDKLKYLDQRFFTNIEINSILIFVCFSIIFLINLSKYIKKIFFKFDIKWKKKKVNELYRHIQASRNIEIENYELTNKISKSKKCKYYLKGFILSLIFSESPNIFIFLFIYYKGFNLIHFNLKSLSIWMLYIIYFNFLIIYLIVNSIRITKILKRFRITELYKMNINLYCDYLFVVGDFTRFSSHSLYWIFELLKNFLIAINLTYFNNFIDFQIWNILVIQLIYVVIINYFNSNNYSNYDFKIFKLLENFNLILLIFLYIYYKSDNKILKNILINIITGIIINILGINILKNLFELLMIIIEKIIYFFRIISNFEKNIINE